MQNHLKPHRVFVEVAAEALVDGLGHVGLIHAVTVHQSAGRKPLEPRFNGRSYGIRAFAGIDK